MELVILGLIFNNLQLPSDLVEVRYVGYKQEDKLLYKAKVSPVEPVTDVWDG